jgi:hypothetical protein
MIQGRNAVELKGRNRKRDAYAFIKFIQSFEEQKQNDDLSDHFQLPSQMVPGPMP